MELKEILKAEMNRRGWNAYDLQKRSGVPQPTLHRILKGEHRNPRRPTVLKLAKALDITEAQLMGIEEIEDHDQLSKDLEFLRRLSDEIRTRQIPRHIRQAIFMLLDGYLEKVNSTNEDKQCSRY
jgi:transcriptional regulator with XRE-family HTH domain